MWASSWSWPCCGRASCVRCCLVGASCVVSVAGSCCLRAACFVRCFVCCCLKRRAVRIECGVEQRLLCRCSVRRSLAVEGSSAALCCVVLRLCQPCNAAMRAARTAHDEQLRRRQRRELRRRETRICAQFKPRTASTNPRANFSEQKQKQTRKQKQTQKQRESKSLRANFSLLCTNCKLAMRFCALFAA